MKINNRVFKTLTGEPFKTQTINGKEVGFYKMNETKFLQENVSRGRFYLWASDGVSYKLLVEEGFYNKVTYFFEEEINAVWIDFLEEVSEVNKKTSRTFLFGSLGLSLLIIVGTLLLDQFGKSESSFMTYGIIGALILTMIGNMIHSSKVNKLVTAKNLAAQNKIRELLTENKFNQLLKDQEEYMKEYFEFDEDEDALLDDENILEESFNELTEEYEEVLEVETEASEVIEVEAEVIEKKVAIDYSNNTVVELKDMARDRNLVGYSALKKAELIKLLEEDDKK